MTTLTRRGLRKKLQESYARERNLSSQNAELRQMLGELLEAWREDGGRGLIREGPDSVRPHHGMGGPPMRGRHCPRCGIRVYLVQDQTGKRFLVGSFDGSSYCR